MTTTTPEEQLRDKVFEVERLIRECEDLADQHKLSFSLTVACGMGGTYIGDKDHRWNDDLDGWHPSSMGC